MKQLVTHGIMDIVIKPFITIYIPQYRVQFLEPKNTTKICMQRTQRWSGKVKICPRSLENGDHNTSQNCEDAGMIKKKFTNEPIWSKRSSNPSRAIGRKQSKNELTSNKEKDFRVYGETPTL